MYNNIAIPVLFDETHDETSSFPAAQILAEEEAKFTIVHVMEPIPSHAPAQIPAEVFARTRLEVQNDLKQTAKALPGAVPTLISGNVRPSGNNPSISMNALFLISWPGGRSNNVKSSHWIRQRYTAIRKNRITHGVRPISKTAPTLSFGVVASFRDSH